MHCAALIVTGSRAYVAHVQPYPGTDRLRPRRRKGDAVDESRRLAMRRAHTKHADYCTCGRVVRGNGGRASHRHMHHVDGDGHHGVTADVWRRMFPEHDGRKTRAPSVTFEQAVRDDARAHPVSV